MNENTIAKHTMENLQEVMTGAAEKAGLKSEDDVTGMIEELLMKKKTPVTDSLIGFFQSEFDLDDDKGELYRSLQEGLDDQKNGKTRLLEECFKDRKCRSHGVK